MNKNFMSTQVINKIKLFLVLGRYNYPIGALLLMWPCLWGVFYKTNNHENLIETILLFVIGSFVMRGAGCCINDFFDRDLDKKVTRTKGRPLASGALNIKEAAFFLCIQLFIGFCVVINFNFKTIFFSFLIIPLVLIYPLMKRIMNYPQFFLGFIFNWGVLIGFMSQSNTLNTGIIFLFLGGVFFTISYDTTYAFQDLKDDKKFGIKSFAIILEKKSKRNIFLLLLLSYFFFTLSLTNIEGVGFSSNLLLSLPILVCYVMQFILFIKKRYKLFFDSSALTGFTILFVFLTANYL